MMPTICATAPAKAILFGEHAVNRGQAALATSIGLSTTVRLAQCATPGSFLLAGGGQQRSLPQAEVLACARQLAAFQHAGDYLAIQQVCATNFFAPICAVLGAAGPALPTGLLIEVESAIPTGVGLGSGGAVFVALAAALAHLLGRAGELRTIAAWARQGDHVAHGGLASGLDTQTSLYGGLIRYTLADEAQPLAHAAGLTLVIGNSGILAPTSVVNGNVRQWLAANPAGQVLFEQIGRLSQQAELALHQGDWPALGRLMNTNQQLLAQIGVSCPALERLIQAALAAGAYGAKLSGSGGGGVMIALVAASQRAAVASAIAQAGGMPINVPVGVPGVQVVLQ